MKFLILLFFIFTFPLFVFFTTILYGSDITPLLKADLKQHHIYSQLSTQLSKFDTGDSNSAIINQLIKNRFTSHYIQEKVDTALDSSDNWIRGKSTKPPVVSFKDVKDDLTTQYPQLLPDIESAAEEMKKQEAQDPSLAQQNPDAAKNLDMIASLAKSDFTIHLNTYLVGFKNFYTALRILQPILALLLLASLILLGVMNKSWPQRLKWIGSTLLISSILGFALAFGNVEIVKLLSYIAAHNANHIVKLASPILLQIIKQYVDAYVHYQNTASLLLLLVAGGCLIGRIFTKNTLVAAVPSKKSRGKKHYTKNF